MSASIHTTTSVGSPIASSTVYNPDQSNTGGSSMGSSEFSPLPPHIQRGLNDRLYEKRKQAALEIERLVKTWISTEPPNKSKAYVAQVIIILQRDYLYRGSNSYTRKGGLIGLAATAIALGYKDVQVHLASLINPVVDCFNDHDPRVRYYGCEALFNVSKVARGHIMPYVAKIFDGLCKLAADEDANVRNGTELLDKLMQDTVAEHVDKFDVSTFVPLLTAKIKSNDKQIALFLVKWIVALNSRPNSHLLKYLPQILEGLFGFLALDDEVVFNQTEDCLREFLNEIREKPEAVQYAAMVNTLVYHTKRTPYFGLDEKSMSYVDRSKEIKVQRVALVWLSEFVKCANREMLPFLSNLLQAILPILSFTGDLAHLAREVNLELQDLITEADDDNGLRVGGGVSSSSTNVINNNNAAESLTSVSSGSIDDQDGPDQTKPKTRGGETNGPTLITFGGKSSSAADDRGDYLNHKGGGGAGGHHHQFHHQHSSHQVHLDVKDTVDTLSHLMNQHNSKTTATQEACLDWLYKLYSTVPHKMFICTENIFPTLILLVRTPADRETQNSRVHHKVLKVLAEIASSDAAPRDLDSSEITCPSQRNVYFRSLLKRLLDSFSSNPELTDLDRSHGLFIIRNLCALLSARDVYRTLSEILLTKAHEERQFVSKMVNLLNTILMTTHELFQLRDELKNFKLPDTKELFCCVYRTWCLCPVAAVSLCLLSGKYRHACRLLHLFGSLEIDVDILNEVDKLVQLLESPIFANLRLQMLEMSDSEQPHLVKAMYSLLMLLPQTEAYSRLRDRLSCIPSPQLMPHYKSHPHPNIHPGKKDTPLNEDDPHLNSAICNGPDGSVEALNSEDLDSDALLDDFRAVNVAQDGTPNNLYSSFSVHLYSSGNTQHASSAQGNRGQQHQRTNATSMYSAPPPANYDGPNISPQQGSTTVSDV